MKDKYDALKLENQLCFPLYACSKEIVRRYKPYLDEIDLTYTQYIAMMVLWEHGRINVKDMGALLYLDSGTLTPVLKKLEQKGYLTRERDHADERVLNDDHGGGRAAKGAGGRHSAEDGRLYRTVRGGCEGAVPHPAQGACVDGAGMKWPRYENSRQYTKN